MSPPLGRDAVRTAALHQAVTAIAQQVVSGDLGIIAGCRQLRQLGHDVVIDSRVDPDFVVFTAVESVTDHLPLEEQRPLWLPSAFAEKQVEVERYEADWRDDVLRACRSVIERFGHASGGG